MTEMAKNLKIDAVLTKLDSKTTEAAVNKVSDTWNFSAILELAKSLKSQALLKKLDSDSLKSVVNKILDKKNEECTKEILVNSNLANMLDDKTKSRMNSINSSADDYLARNMEVF